MFKRKRNTETIVRDLNIMVEELLEWKQECNAEAGELKMRIDDLVNRRTESLRESLRASNVAEKIEELVK